MASKVFRFRAKQGQHLQVAGILTSLLKLTVTMKPIEGGFEITAPLPEGTSKRSIDRMLKFGGVPGAIRG
jgi:hypothetical protein